MLKVQVSFLLVIYTYFFVPTISEKKYFLISKKKAGEPYGAILAFSFQQGKLSTIFLDRTWKMNIGFPVTQVKTNS